MAFKLIESAQHRWKGITAGHLTRDVRAGVKFVNGYPKTPQETLAA
jgi:hypothetical protein